MNYKVLLVIVFIFSIFFIKSLIKSTDNYEIFSDEYTNEEGDLRIFCIIKTDQLYLNTNVI